MEGSSVRDMTELDRECRNPRESMGFGFLSFALLCGALVTLLVLVFVSERTINSLNMELDARGERIFGLSATIDSYTAVLVRKNAAIAEGVAAWKQAIRSEAVRYETIISELEEIISKLEEAT